MFVFRVDSIDSLTLVSTQILKLHMSCVKGLHHHVPILFDYYHFAVIDTTIHATVTALGLPNNRCVNDVRFDIVYLMMMMMMKVTRMMMTVIQNTKGAFD